MFKGAGNLADLEINQSRFVGWLIELADYQNISMLMHKIGFQFSKALTAHTLYLYHSSQRTALTSQAFTTTAANTFE